MRDQVLVQYQIPATLFEGALKPIGRLPVQLGSLEVAKTKVDQSGLASFYLPVEIHHKIVNHEYQVRTLHYHPDEENLTSSTTAQIVSLSIVRPSQRSTIY